MRVNLNMLMLSPSVSERIPPCMFCSSYAEETTIVNDTSIAELITINILEFLDAPSKTLLDLTQWNVQTSKVISI